MPCLLFWVTLIQSCRFERLHRELRSTAPVIRPTAERTPQGRSSLAFFEAYFSNFIEGTEFEVSEAAETIIPGEDAPSE